MLWLLIILAMLTALPLGYLLAWLAKDELVAGRKWFIALSVASFVAILSLIFVYRNYQIIFTLAYVIIVCLVSIWKSCKLHKKRN